MNLSIGTRRAKLGHLTRQMLEIEALLGDSGNVNNVFECITAAKDLMSEDDVAYTKIS